MKGLSCFIDTNIFLRVVVKDDRRKVADCETLIRSIIEGKIKAITSSLVLAELVWTCLSFYKISKFEVIKILRGVLSIKNLKIEDKFEPLSAIEYYTKYGVKFIDCLIASNPKAGSRKMKVISYDKDFDKLGVIRIEPDQI